MNAENTPTVLWLDDDIDKMPEYVEALRRAGLTVVATTSAISAIDICKRTQFNVLLIDLRMDEMDGVEFIEKAIKLQESAALVVVSSYLYFRDYRDRLA